MPFLVILQVIGIDDTTYAYAVQRIGWGMGCCPYGDPTFYSSQDGGNTWLEITTPPLEMEQKLIKAGMRSNQSCEEKRPDYCTRVDGLGRVWDTSDGGKTWNKERDVSYPGFEEEEELAYKSLDYRPICSKTNMLVCFRLNEQGQIERSLDGGANWGIDWQLPNGRREFLLRSYASNRTGIMPNIRPLDLTFFDTAEGISVMAAMGNQEIMVRSPQGLWERRAVDDARPLPYAAKSLREAFKIVYQEVVRSALIAFLFAILLSGIDYIVLGYHFPVTKKNNKQPWLPVYTGLVIIITTLFLTGWENVLSITEEYQIQCLVVFTIIMLIAWGIAILKFREVNHFKIVNLLILIYLLIMFTETSLPYLLWTLGTIATFEVALLLSIGLGVLVGVLGFTHTIWLSVKIAKTA
jgi:hypothetical protein